jgi:hypothetical protein
LKLPRKPSAKMLSGKIYLLFEHDLLGKRYTLFRIMLWRPDQAALA